MGRVGISSAEPGAVYPIWRPLNFNNIFSTSRWHTSTKFQPILVSSYPVAVVRILLGQTGTGYSKMAAAKPEIHLSQFIDMMARRFQWLGIYSRWRAIYLEFTCRHLEFPASGLVDQHHNQYHRITGPSKHRNCRCDFVPILSTSWKVGTSTSEATILDFSLPGWSYVIIFSSIGLLHPKAWG